MSETFHWIEGGSLGRLASMLHLPDASGPHPSLLMCHGFTGTRVEPQRLYVQFARRLCARGVAVLRFDFGGHGDSEGQFRDLTLPGESRDARSAWDFLGRHPLLDPARRALMGFSLGGFVAASCAEILNPRALALWAPVDDPVLLQVRFLGLHGADTLRAGGSVDVGGDELGPGFLREMPQEGQGPPGQGWKGPTLLIQGERDDSVPRASYDAYKSAFKERGTPCRSSLLPGAGHHFSSSAHRKKLYDESETFLLEHLEGRP